jgi:hypothetical protein
LRRKLLWVERHAKAEEHAYQQARFNNLHYQRQAIRMRSELTRQGAIPSSKSEKVVPLRDTKF